MYVCLSVRIYAQDTHVVVHRCQKRVLIASGTGVEGNPRPSSEAVSSLIREAISSPLPPGEMGSVFLFLVQGCYTQWDLFCVLPFTFPRSLFPLHMPCQAPPTLQMHDGFIDPSCICYANLKKLWEKLMLSSHEEFSSRLSSRHTIPTSVMPGIAGYVFS